MNNIIPFIRVTSAATGTIYERYQKLIEGLRAVIDSQVAGSQVCFTTSHRKLDITLHKVGATMQPIYYVRYGVRTSPGRYQILPFAFDDIERLRECVRFLVLKNPVLSTIRTKYREDSLAGTMSHLLTERMQKAMSASA